MRSSAHTSAKQAFIGDLHALMEIPQKNARHFSQCQLSKIGAAVTVVCDVTTLPWRLNGIFAPAIPEPSSTVINHPPATADTSVRDVDRDLLVAMRDGQTAGIGELTQRLQVTATAIRQRIERLLEARLIDREKSVAGRGRPTYHYCINNAGRQVIGADPSDLVQAMWEEILAIEDPQLRDLMLQRVAERLGREYAAQLDDEAPLDERMQRLSALLASRRVSSDVISSGELPVLDIGTCPFPTLADGTNDHSMCRLEEKVLSEALGEQLQLSQCRLDGDACCQFSPAEQTASTDQPQATKQPASSNHTASNHTATGSHHANGKVG